MGYKKYGITKNSPNGLYTAYYMQTTYHVECKSYESNHTYMIGGTTLSFTEAMMLALRLASHNEECTYYVCSSTIDYFDFEGYEVYEYMVYWNMFGFIELVNYENNENITPDYFSIRE